MVGGTTKQSLSGVFARRNDEANFCKSPQRLLRYTCYDTEIASLHSRKDRGV